jgi:hypothetical protein
MVMLVAVLPMRWSTPCRDGQGESGQLDFIHGFPILFTTVLKSVMIDAEEDLPGDRNDDIQTSPAMRLQHVAPRSRPSIERARFARPVHW